MKVVTVFLAGLLLPACWGIAVGEKTKDNKPMYGIAIHGGAGTIPRAEMTAEREAAYHAGLEQALDAGYRVLDKGGSSLDAVTAAVRILEDNELFNAGRGAVFNRAGEVELDAAIMNGATLAAGSVAGLKRIKNPIDLARKVMEESPHVMLIGAGAEAFAFEHGVEPVPNSYFYTERRRKQLDKLLSGDRIAASHLDYFESSRGESSWGGPLGTVGAVARDRDGNLAAATSTGGLTGKLPGRVGDSPIIGAGTYANNKTCAISATGHGELFIRSVVGHDLSALMEYRGLTLQQAMDEVVQRKLKAIKGEGGVIAIDADGGIVMEFNSEGMFRGARDSGGRREIGIY